MTKNLSYEKILLCSIFVVLFTSCGGGGGGGSPSNVRPNEAPNTSKEVKKEIKPKIIEFKKEIPTNDISDKKITIAILDGDFLTNKENLKKEYKDLVIIENGADNNITGTKHAERVLKVLQEEGNFKIIAASIGKNKKSALIPNIEIYETIYNELSEEKIKIINQSWGSPYNNSIEKLSDNQYLKSIFPSDLTGKELQEYYKKMITFFKDAVQNKGGLFVWANGNRKKEKELLNYPTLQAQLPIKFKELEKGWISVVGVKHREEVELDNGKKGYILNKHYHEHLAYPKNARYWAISASGEASGYYGSSFATPRVVRAAALVARKYDWLTNAQVREVLFTTTDKPELKYNQDGTLYKNQDIRYKDSEPTAEYGWGILNEKRALKGIGAFYKYLIAFEDKSKPVLFNANLPQNRVSAFENDIHGDGGLRKTGKGRLLLKGNNTYKEPTYIEEGTLDIYKLHTSNIIVRKDGTLELHNGASIGKEKNEKDNGNLFNEGKVVVGEKNSHVTVHGDYIATKNSITEYEEGAKLEVKGITKLDESDLKLHINSYTSRDGEESTIITGNSIEGNFEKVEVNGNRTIVVRKESNLSENSDNKVEKTKEKVIVRVSRENSVDYLTGIDNIGEARLNTAANIDKILKNIDLSVEEGKVNPEILEFGENILNLSPKELSEATSRMTAEIYASSQILIFNQADNINRNISNHFGNLKSFKNSGYDWQGWYSGIISKQSIEQDGYAGAKTNFEGTQFGLDKKIDNRTQAGIAFDYSYASADFDRYAGNFKSDGVGISIYMKRYFENDIYLLGKIGSGRYSTRVKREILDAKLDTQIGDIKSHNIMLSSYCELGKNFNYITPFIAYSFDKLKRGDFREDNAEWGIEAKAKNYIKNSIVLGVRGEYRIDKYKLKSSITHSINIGNRSLDFDGQFRGSEMEMKFKGIEQIKNIIWVDIGISRDITNQLGINTNIDMRFNGKKRAETTFSVGLEYRF